MVAGTTVSAAADVAKRVETSACSLLLRDPFSQGYQMPTDDSRPGFTDKERERVHRTLEKFGCGGEDDALDSVSYPVGTQTHPGPVVLAAFGRGTLPVRGRHQRL